MNTYFNASCFHNTLQSAVSEAMCRLTLCFAFQSGFNPIISALAMPVIHGPFSWLTQGSWLPDPLFSINTNNIHKCVTTPADAAMRSPCKVLGHGMGAGPLVLCTFDPG